MIESKLNLATDAVDTAVQPDSLIGRTLSKNYTLTSLLGMGGMGKVYLAMNEGLKRRVAIKVLEAGKGTVAVERFNAEAKTAAQIESPHVVAVTDHFSDDMGNHFIVMEYVDGPDMETILVQQGVFTLERLLSIARQIARALAAAHRLGIVHRDLKLENVIVIRMDDEGEFAKILDFGIAKIVSEAMQQKLDRRKLTADNVVFLGTPWYMAPEQALGKEVDQRTDVYAFGVLIYRALTGEYPIDGNTVTEVYSRLIDKDDNTTSITARRPEYAHLWPVLRKAMAKDRDLRYPDAKSFVDALEDAAGVPRLSRPSGIHHAALGRAATIDVSGARQAPQHAPDAVTLDTPVPPPAAIPPRQDAPSGMSPQMLLLILVGLVLAGAVGMTLLIGNRDPRQMRAPPTSAILAPPPAHPHRTAPTPPAEVPHGVDPPAPSRVVSPPVVRTVVAAPVAPRPAVAPTTELPAACQAFLPRRRGAGRADCLRYHAAVCAGAHRTPWCDVIEATLRLPRSR